MELRNAEKEVNNAVIIYQSLANKNIKGIDSNRMDAWEKLLPHCDIQGELEASSEITTSNDELSPSDFLTQLESFKDCITSLKSVTDKFKERVEMVRNWVKMNDIFDNFLSLTKYQPRPSERSGYQYAKVRGKDY